MGGKVRSVQSTMKALLAIAVPITIGAAAGNDKVDRRQERADGDAQNGRAGGLGAVAGVAQHEPREAQAED